MAWRDMLVGSKTQAGMVVVNLQIMTAPEEDWVGKYENGQKRHGKT